MLDHARPGWRPCSRSGGSNAAAWNSTCPRAERCASTASGWPRCAWASATRRTCWSRTSCSPPPTSEAVAESACPGGPAGPLPHPRVRTLTKLEDLHRQAMGLRLPRPDQLQPGLARVLAQAHATSSGTWSARCCCGPCNRPATPRKTPAISVWRRISTSTSPRPSRRYPDWSPTGCCRRSSAARPLPAAACAFPAQESSFVEAGVHLSRCERKAIEIERNVHARQYVLFLFDRVGETFTAIISGVTTFGLFVALEEVFVSGSVPLKTMTDDYYLFDGRRFRLVGRVEQPDLPARRGRGPARTGRPGHASSPSPCSARLLPQRLPAKTAEPGGPPAGRGFLDEPRQFK